MNTWVGALLAIVVAAVAAVALVFVGFSHEKGRQRLLPWLRPLLKGVINPRMLRALARGRMKYAVVHHVGRRSGMAYQTPAEAYRTAQGTLVLLPYGPITDWCRNVLAAGTCTITIGGQDLALRAPEVIPASVAESRVPAEVARRWHRQGIAHYLWLQSATPREASVASA